MHGETLCLQGSGQGSKVSWDKSLNTSLDTCINGCGLVHEYC
jgi:hypothetical protein